MRMGYRRVGPASTIRVYCTCHRNSALAQRSSAAPPHAPPELITVPPPAVPPRPPTYDPYAGASVPG